MSKKTISAIMLSLLVISTLTLALKIQIVRADGGTITINSDGSINPSTAPIYTADNITYILTGNITANVDGIVVERNNIVLDGAGFTVQGNGTETYNGIDLSNRTSVTIENMIIKAFNVGIWLNSSSDNIISGNQISYIPIAIGLASSSNNAISGNNIIANFGDYGITLESSSNYNIISGNNVTNNYEGIWLRSSLGNVISGNNITNNGYSIWLYLSATYNNVSGNNITNNSFGVSLGMGSTSNNISGNSITDNGYGIFLGTDNNTISENNITTNDNGIWLYSSSGNSIFHNRFVNNTIQIISNDSTNIWDNGYPSGGNYWGDYNGTDVYSGTYQNLTGSDGIGDTPYVIDSNNIDHYPIANPVVVVPPPKLVGDLNGDGKVSLQDLQLLANAYGSKVGDPN